MAEIKHTFTAGKMNKDFDERLVPNGEYRDAMNIQVRTTDGQVGDSGENVGLGDAGTVQNIMGTASMGSSIQPGSNDLMYTVASISYEKNDVAYFFFACSTDVPTSSSDITSQTIYYDNIVEQHINGATTPVVVDRFAVTSTYANAGSPTFTDDVSFNITGADSLYRVGMVVTALDADDNNLIPGAIISSISGDTITLFSQAEPATWTFTNCVALKFEIPEEDRLLKFNKTIRITGINIIDDLLFWTDNHSEPKKINITRCKAGTDNFNTHTRLMVEDPLALPGADLVTVSDLEFAINSDLKEEHITVLRKAPRMAPTLHMDSRSDSSISVAEVTTADLSGVVNGDVIIITDGNLNNPLAPTLFRSGDIIKFTDNGTADGDVPGIIKATFISYIDTNNEEVAVTTESIKIQIISKNEQVFDFSLEWSMSVELTKPLFELKFVRFGYRYRYEDGEYSSFSPWSELAFLPAPYDYEVKKGYNLGMINTVRELVIKDFVPWIDNRPHDVIAVDVLYKTTDSPNVYTVKTIEREKDAEWELYTYDGVNINTLLLTGQLNITSEMIHQVLPSNQMLRAWDNVPRYAKAQEMSANRLIYGNYVQGYNLTHSPSLIQSISSENTATLAAPKKSIKSIRNYKFGLVIGDEYGRETPVISTGYSISDGAGGFDTLTGDIIVEKQLAKYANRFTLKQDWVKPGEMISDEEPDLTWMDYVKYYVKETTNEYYNLVLDRWYNAEDGNIWLSFPSADRNKLDEETYIILKNGHGNQTPVEESARYKIIAIENEAPDFIKITTKNMGLVKLNSDSVSSQGIAFDPETDSPNFLTAETSIEIEPSGWNNFLGHYDNLGDLKFRVVGRIQVGDPAVILGERRSDKWTIVTHWSQDSAGGEDGGSIGGKINWGDQIGSSANMLTSFTDSGIDPPFAGDLTYFLEFKQEVTKNKPEFDGRFFALIEKDVIIQENIMKQSMAVTEKEVTDTFLVSYIDTVEKHPSPFEGEFSGTNPYVFGDYQQVTVDGIIYPDSGANQYVNGGFTFGDDGVGNFINEFGLTETPEGFTKAGLLNAFGLGVHFVPSVAKNNPLNQTGDVIYNRSSATKGFWDSWVEYNNIWIDDGVLYENRPQADLMYVFLDGARARKYSPPTSTPNVDGYEFHSVNDTNIDGGRASFAYKPTALDQGGADAGTLGRMCFGYQDRTANPVGASVFGGNGDNPSNLMAIAFKNAMGIPGNHFQFKDDTTNNGMPHVYRIINQNASGEAVLGIQSTQNGINHGRTQGGGGGNIDVNTNSEYFNDQNGYWGDFNNPVGDDTGYGVGFHGSLRDLPWTEVHSNTDDQDLYIDIDDAFGNPQNRLLSGAGGFIVDNAIVNARNSNQSMNDVVAPNGVGGAQIPNMASNNGLSIGNPPAIGSGSGEGFLQFGISAYGAFSNDNNTVSSAKRAGIRIEFRRLDPDTGELTNQGIAPEVFDPRALTRHDGNGFFVMEMVEFISTGEGDEDISTDGAVWETEPKEDIGLDLYYEATQAIPMVVSQSNWSTFAPFNCKIIVKAEDDNGNLSIVDLSDTSVDVISEGEDGILGTSDDITTPGAATKEDFHMANIIFTNTGAAVNIKHFDIVGGFYANNEDIVVDNFITFVHNDGLETTTKVLGFVDVDGNPSSTATGYYAIDTNAWKYPVKLSWFNCYSFGNAVESDRIRDDYNASMIDNGVKVSTTVSGYKEETKKSGMIYSGIYNSTSGVNDFNEFNMAEKITKDLNPSYGSIQALKTRDRDVVVFTEDKVLRVLSNKDAVFNADGKPQLIATNRVLGEAMPFAGEYGISKNPESLATDQYRMYFTDKQRGAVLRLSGDGLTPISNVGMKSWFRQNLKTAPSILGTFDKVNGEYNVTLGYNIHIPTDFTQFTQAEQTNILNRTISFNEASKGWVSFKSFIPQSGESVGGKYITTQASDIHQHYVEILDANREDTNRNKFYGAETAADSTLTVLFNDTPGIIKSFQTMNYEGTQSRVNQFWNGTDPSGLNPGIVYTDGEYYNLVGKHGWYVESFETDQFNQITNPGQSAHVPEFINKENKWFNKITGVLQPENEIPGNIDSSEFTVQGIGIPTSSNVPPQTDFTLTVQNDPDN